FCNPQNPLQYKEIKATVRSVARWTWKNFDSHTFHKSNQTEPKNLEKPMLKMKC
ncbi:hypothetical protein CKQ87_28270, partial [Klebsiella pneumoniae]